MKKVNNVQKQKLLTEMVMRQTSLSFEDCDNLLKKYNNNYIDAIKEGIGILNKEKEKEKEKEIKSINQEIYINIRGMMDNAAERYRIKKENEEYKEKMLEKMQEEYERRTKIKEEDTIKEEEEEDEKEEEEEEKEKEEEEEEKEKEEEKEEEREVEKEFEMIEDKENLESLD